MKRFAMLMLACLLVGGTACEKTSDQKTDEKTNEKTDEKTTDQKNDQKTEEKDEKETSEKQGESDSQFAKAIDEKSPFDETLLTSAAESWQGNWVFTSTAGKLAWQVEGNKVKQFYGDEEKSLTMTILAPCKAQVTEKTDGGSQSTNKTFAHGETKTFAGLGRAGVITDDGAIVCDGRKIYELTSDGCKAWERGLFDKWESEEAECAMEDDTFTVDSKTFEKVDGVLVNQQMKTNVAESFDSYEKAKAAAKKE